MSANPNREIYNRNYTAAQLAPAVSTPWDRYLVDLRMRLVREHGAGRDVLDLCCGSGVYLLPNLPLFRHATAVDFSSTMLDALREAAGDPPPENLTVTEEDAQELSLPDASVDFVWSYTSLYYLPRLDRALAHVARVLRPGGRAALELGNSRSLNELVVREQHRDAGWARMYCRPYGALRRLLDESGLRPVEWHALQLLPMYGAPRRLRPLAPLLSPRWKNVLGRVVAGRAADEWLSGVEPLRRLAFRHLVLVERR